MIPPQAVTKNYLLECLEQLSLSDRVLKNLGFDDLQALSHEIHQIFHESATQLDFYQSDSLQAWFIGLMDFYKNSFSIPAIVHVTSDESKTIKSLFQNVFQLLFRRIHHRVDILKAIFQAIDQWQRTYNETTKTGFRLGMDIRVTVPEPNPFAKENETHYLMLCRLLSAIEQGTITKLNWSKLTPSEQFGAYLFSAITQSGLTHKNQMNQLVKVSLERRQMDQPFSGFLFFKDRKQAKRTAYDSKILNNDSINVYRWMPDPLTKRIYERYRKNWDCLISDQKKINTYIDEYLQTLLKHKVDKSTNTDLDARVVEAINHLRHLPALLKGSQAYQRRTLPSFIWHYLDNSYQTKDLEPSSIERLHEFKFEINHSVAAPLSAAPLSASPNTSKSLDTKALKDKEDLLQLNNGIDSADVPPKPMINWCKQIIEILDARNSTNEKIIEISQLKDTFPIEDFSLIHLLSNWVIDAISNSPIKRICSYAKEFFPALIANYDLDEDLSEFDDIERQEEIEELIAENIDQDTDKNTYQETEAVFREAWHQLHIYLLSISHISAEQYLNLKNKKPKVDAEYISEIEYRGMQAYLCDQDIPIRLKNQCLLILTLAYRFGLRRSEVIKLATNHISYKNDRPDQLSIRWWSERRLKSSSSKRTLPIFGVLTTQEYQWLHLMTLKRRNSNCLDTDLFDLDTFTLESLIAKELKIYEAKVISQNLKDITHLPIETFLFIDDGKSVDARISEIVNIIHDTMRAVVGNKKLRLHHLRHSCAMNTLMLLLSPKLGKSKPLLLSMIYGNEHHTQQHIRSFNQKSQQFFNQFIFNAEVFEKRSQLLREALFNQQYTSSSEVYTTSRLLGHSSPRTTFASYIHILPLLTSAFLYERYENYSIKLQKALSPHHPRTLNRNKKAIQSGKLKTLVHQQKLGRPVIK